MKLFVGGDHAGFELKKELIEFLKSECHDVTDFGAFEMKPEDDYPDFVIPVAKAVAGNPLSRGIIIGGSGQGEAICANRFKGIRAVVFNGVSKRSDLKSGERSDLSYPDEIKLSREHNDSNVLSLGARFLNFDEVKEAVSKWLATPFSNEERHIRRLSKIKSLGC